MAIVVSDTSPLLYLAKLGLVDVLKGLYGEVKIPRTVWDELVESRPDAAEVTTLRSAAWVQVVDDVPLPLHVAPILQSVDAGEAAAIALALAIAADLLLIDDAAGRRAAEAAGLSVRGTLGVLVSAKKCSFIPALAPVIESLLNEGFRAGPDVVEGALNAAGEAGQVPPRS